jgi:hypothetical protein
MVPPCIVQREMSPLYTVVTRVPAFCAIIYRPFRHVRDARSGLHILPSDLYRDEQTEWCAVVHGKRFSVEVSRQQRLRMLCCRQIERHEIWIWISRGIKIDRGGDTRPFRLRDWRLSARRRRMQRGEADISYAISTGHLMCYCHRGEECSTACPEPATRPAALRVSSRTDAHSIHIGVHLLHVAVE